MFTFSNFNGVREDSHYSEWSRGRLFHLTTGFPSMSWCINTKSPSWYLCAILFLFSLFHNLFHLVLSEVLHCLLGWEEHVSSKGQGCRTSPSGSTHSGSHSKSSGSEESIHNILSLGCPLLKHLVLHWL